ncbi:DUF6318 family protein [Knoellia sp. S7-12]|uniref:DUF6318 family protein n=1 Tax=Knoellia sp. S7-12 TaxID=3126698 RepID=UPI0033664D93
MNKRRTMTYAVAAATAATLALAGCNGGDKDPTPTPTASSSSTSTASPSGSKSPSPTASASPSKSTAGDTPPAARAKTNDGALAFVRFYFDQVNLAYTKPDVNLLPPLVTNACQSCSGLQKGVVDIAAAGQRMKSNLVAPIPSATIATEAPAGETWVRFTLSQMTVPVIDKSGKELEGQKASSVAKIVAVVWEGDQWKIHGIANQS